MIVRVKRHHLDYFKKKACSYKTEVFAFLLGLRISPNLLEVHRFKYPKLMDSTAEGVWVSEEEYTLSEETAKDDGLLLLGGIHSHLDWTQEMSHQDYHNHRQNGEKVTGIVGIVGDKIFTSFWVIESSLPCKLEYL
jgi:hypothetical protein